MKEPPARILIIDDDEQVRALLRDFLSPEHECITVGSGEEALTVIEDGSFDLVLSDIQMPGINGLQLVPRILRHAPETVVVMISAEQAIESAIEAMRVGAFDYVTKPVDLRHARAAVERALSHQRLLADKRRYENHLQELVKERTAEIEHLAYHDRLTNLPNRTLFLDRLEQAFAARGPGSRSAAVLLISLDRLKRITDTLGHAAGDTLICEAAQRLRSCLCQDNLLARFDAGEFAMLLPQLANAHEAAKAAFALAEAMKRAFLLADEQEVFLTTSIGIALWPAHGDSASEIMRNAGAALDLARQQGGNAHRFYAAEMNAQALRSLGLEMNLRRAVEGNEFITYYQPIVNLTTGKAVGFEALVRWQHPRLGLLGPGDFIGLAEDTGLILDIGTLVMNAACRQVRIWQQNGLEQLRIAVNVSARQFRDENFCDRLLKVLSYSRLDPQFVELEITETTIIENLQSATAVLTDLRRMAIRVSIDDFGTGYSSLSYLKHLPVDTVKLDRSFVIGASSDPKDAALVMAIITLAHNLGLNVIAEGIETERQREFLRLFRCDEGQGYLLGRPALAEAWNWPKLDAQRKQNLIVGARPGKLRREPLKSSRRSNW